MQSEGRSNMAPSTSIPTVKMLVIMNTFQLPYDYIGEKNLCHLLMVDFIN